VKYNATRQTNLREIDLRSETQIYLMQKGISQRGIQLSARAGNTIRRCGLGRYKEWKGQKHIDRYSQPLALMIALYAQLKQLHTLIVQLVRSFKGNLLQP
jgi:hypothetical protein